MQSKVTHKRRPELLNTAASNRTASGREGGARQPRRGNRGRSLSRRRAATGGPVAVRISNATRPGRLLRFYGLSWQVAMARSSWNAPEGSRTRAPRFAARFSAGIFRACCAMSSRLVYFQRPSVAATRAPSRAPEANGWADATPVPRNGLNGRPVVSSCSRSEVNSQAAESPTWAPNSPPG